MYQCVGKMIDILHQTNVIFFIRIIDDTFSVLNLWYLSIFIIYGQMMNEK